MAFDYSLFDHTNEAADRRVALAEAIIGEANQDVLAEFLEPPPDLTIPDWADEYRILPPGSPDAGPWETSKFEIVRGPLLAVHEPGVRILSCKAATQSGKSEVQLSILGYHIHISPKQALLVTASEEAAREFSLERLEPMIALAKDGVLARLVPPGRKNPGNKALYKKFPGGSAKIASGQSPTELASRPAALLLFDEVSRIPLDNGEGDPVGQARARTSNYEGSWFQVFVSSPREKGSCRISGLYDESDQRKPFVPCPHCGHRQVLRFGSKDSPGGIKWSRDSAGVPLPGTAAYHCTSCGAGWSERQREEAIAKVDWRQCRKFSCCGVDHDPEADHEAGHERVWAWNNYSVWRATCRECGRWAVPNYEAGFWWSRLYNRKYSVERAARDFLGAYKVPEQLRTFVETILGESWEPPAEAIDASALINRRETYPDELPDGAVLLVAGVDTQDNRLEVTILAIGRDIEMWVVDHHTIVGDTSEPETWAKLKEYLSRRWRRRDGMHFVVSAACIDRGGHRAEQVSNFCHANRSRRWVPIYGAKDLPPRYKEPWSGRIAKSAKGPMPPFELGTNSIKFGLQAAYSLPERGVAGSPQPGRLHFSDRLDEDYFKKFTSERVLTEKKAGVLWRWWDNPPGARNEPWDCAVYGYAAFKMLQHEGTKINEVAAKFAFRELAVAEAEARSAALPPTSPAPNAEAPGEAQAAPAATTQPARVAPPARPPSRPTPQKWMKPRRRWG